MASPAPAVSVFFNHITEWAANEPAISGVALVGSHARGDARPDSDIDLVLLCVNPQAWLRDASWIHRFGEVAGRQTEDWGRVTSLRVYYRSGLEVEFGLTTPAWAELPVDSGTRDVVLNGIRILLDRDQALARLQDAIDHDAS